MATRYARRLTPLAVMATLLLTSAAKAEPALEVGPVADLVAAGAGIDVPVAVACDAVDPGGTQNLFVQVRQAGGDVVASGSGFTDDLVCNGEAQDLTVAVLADPGSRPFHAGKAALEAGLSVCSFAPGAVSPAPEAQAPGAPAPEAQAPGAQQVTPPEEPLPPEPTPPPGPTPGPPVAPPPGDVAPCTSVNVSSVIFIHSMEMESHPALP